MFLREYVERSLTTTSSKNPATSRLQITVKRQKRRSLIGQSENYQLLDGSQHYIDLSVPFFFLSKQPLLYKTNDDSLRLSLLLQYNEWNHFHLLSIHLHGRKIRIRKKYTLRGSPFSRRSE
jgi:hypothetical protein